MSLNTPDKPLKNPSTLLRYDFGIIHTSWRAPKEVLCHRPLVSKEGANTDLPKLKVNTAKELKPQASMSAEPPLMDFYSPVSSLYNSPLSGCT